MTTEVKVSPEQIVQEAHDIMSQVAQIVPDGATSVTRQARQSSYFAMIIEERSLGNTSIAHQEKYDPEAESTTAYALRQANKWKEHLSVLAENNQTATDAFRIAQSMAVAMRTRFTELTNKKAVDSSI